MKRFLICVIVLLCLATGLFSSSSNVKAALVFANVSPIKVLNKYNHKIIVEGTDIINGASVLLEGFNRLSKSSSSTTESRVQAPARIPIGIHNGAVTNPDFSTALLAYGVKENAETPTVEPSSTVEPPGSYERPMITVDTYSLDQDTISPGDTFTLFVTLYNSGQQYAKNIIATFSGTDLLPTGTGGVVAVGEIAPGNHSEFAQPLYLNNTMWATVTSINMVVSYTNETGAAYSETFTISLPVHLVYYSGVTATPTPTQTPTASIKPQLVITSYATDVNPLQPGTQFNLTVNIKNMGNSTAKNVTMIVGGGSSSSSGDVGTQQPGGVSGGNGEFTNFAPIGSSNVQSIGDFSPGKGFTTSQALIVNVNTAPGAYPLKISFVYINDQNQTFVDDQVITLLVYRLPIVEVSFYQQMSTLLVGQPNTLPIQVVNLGRNSIVLGTMRVVGSSGQLSNNSILIGNLDPGGYFTLDATFIPDSPGLTDLNVSIDYTNDFNQPQVISQTLTVEVMEQPIIEPPSDGNQNNGIDVPVKAPETFFHKVWRFILGLVGLDSGLTTIQSSGINQPAETPSTEQPIIIPAKPPLKGP
jgi:uncharacterized repeat protein (TIGR01451 family)